MTEYWAGIAVTASGLYLLAGALFTIPFLVSGVGRVDRSAAGASLAFRLLIAPGCTLLWPLLIVRWVTATGAPPAESTAHRRLASAQERRKQ